MESDGEDEESDDVVLTLLRIPSVSETVFTEPALITNDEEAEEGEEDEPDEELDIPDPGADLGHDDDDDDDDDDDFIFQQVIPPVIKGTSFKEPSAQKDRPSKGNQKSYTFKDKGLAEDIDGSSFF